MKRILAFSFFPAFVPPSNGGESRLFSLYSSLSRYHHVTLISSTHQDVPEDKVRHGANFVERRIPKDASFTTAWNTLSPLSGGGDLSAPCILQSATTWNPLHDAYLDEYEDADVIIHDSPFTLPYDLFFGLDDKPRIYNAYNCESDLYRTLHLDSRSKPIWELVSTAEKRLLGGCDAVFYCSTDDLEAFEKLAPDATFKCIFVPNGFTPKLESVATRRHSGGIKNVVFMGSAHPPNIQAARTIAERFAPALPDCTFHLVGNCLPQGDYPANVVRHGFVSDAKKDGVLQQANLAINPMESGSGSNLKVFEFLANGIPLLSTKFGIRGIQATRDVDYLEASCDDFPRVIEAWSDRLDELAEIGQNGKRLVEKDYRWDTIAAHAASAISEIESRAPWNDPYVLVLNDYDSFRDTGGGGVRTRGLYAALNEWAPVIFLCFSETDEIRVRAENERTIVACIPKTKEHIEEIRLAREEHVISINDIVAHRMCRSNRVFVSVYNTLKKNARCVVVEHPYLAILPISCRDRFVYSSQNAEAGMKEGLLWPHPRHDELVREVRELEEAAIRSASTVVAVSRADAESFSRSARSVGPVIVVPNGGEEPACPSRDERERVLARVEDSTAVVFVGSAHMPNIDAAKFIVEALAPRHPDVQFHLVGSVCNVFADIPTPNVSAWGMVSDSKKTAIMQSCHLAINPVISGGGSNIKLADYLANGLFVLTSPFGIRGYPDDVSEHVLVSEIAEFEKKLPLALSRVRSEPGHAADMRRQYFHDRLSMKALGMRFANQLQSLEKEKKRILIVTYRYTQPALGGAESMLARLIEALDERDDYQIDVVSPEVSSMRNVHRFSEYYSFDPETNARTGLKNVRFARFPNRAEPTRPEMLRKAWGVQLLFDRALFEHAGQPDGRDGLAWGWSDPEITRAGTPSRWAYTSCALTTRQNSTVTIEGYAPLPAVVRAQCAHGRLLGSFEINGRFELSLEVPAGLLELSTSIACVTEDDPRPLALLVDGLEINGQEVDLSAPPLHQGPGISDADTFAALDNASQQSRGEHSVRLTDLRGPFSPSLEDYLKCKTKDYDLVVTHNPIFRPAVAAVEQANGAGVPVIMIPHAHLDDDFYHFPDMIESVLNSDLVLASPRPCCDFYREKGANVSYLPAGIDLDEPFTSEDTASFDAVCNVDEPFVLVLGRKAGAKGYRQVIEAVESLAERTRIHLVMIGPDDDGAPVQSRHATYLGRQPRSVVRGALLRSRAVVNMSASESFGIVILEAWIAARPVVVNRNCPAFRDLAIAEENALMVSDSEQLEQALERLWNDVKLCRELGANGKNRAESYGWVKIGADFVNACEALIEQSRGKRSRP